VSGSPGGRPADPPDDAPGPPDALLTELTAALGAGEATARTYFERASDRMRAAFRRESDLARAFGNDRFAPLLRAKSAELVTVERIGTSARGTVIVTDGAGALAGGDQVVTYILAVAVARYGAHEGEWRLSGVAREGVDL